MSRWGSMCIHTGDLLKLEAKEFRAAISALRGRSECSPRKALVRGFDGWKRKHEIEICLSLNDEQMPVVDYLVRVGKVETSGQIQFAQTACRFGGNRYYFVCPVTRKRCAVLRLYRGMLISLEGVRQLTRMSIPYTCQTLSGFDRVRRQVKLSEGRAEKRGIVIDESVYYQKPKGMHWNTFSRLVGDIEKAQERENRWIWVHWGRRLGLS